MTDDSFSRGLALRRHMFGAAGAENQVEAATDFTRPLQEWVTHQCFGEAWHRPALDNRTRSMITLSMLIALGREHEIKVHVRGAIANGVTKDEIREIMMHSIIYCGVPLAVGAFRAAVEVLKELGLE
jgi:4-carboxymuconolactone decarboxylase